MKKAPDAFRTISEVAEILETPAHVLRFWESKFYQIRPVKRAGGRRYYRPDDVSLINGIRSLLQDQGMTIRGVQRVLQEQGVKHVVALGNALPTAILVDDPELIDATGDDGGTYDGDEADVIEVAETAPFPTVAAPSDDIHANDATLEDAEKALQTELSEVVATDDHSMPLSSNTVEPPTADESPDTEHSVEHDHLDTNAPPPVPTVETARVDEDVATSADAPEIESIAASAAKEDPDTPDANAKDDAAADEPVAAQSKPPVPAQSPAKPPLPVCESVEPDQAAEQVLRIAQSLRTRPRGTLGKSREPLERLGRRIDVLLERMSEASGAGRW